MLKKTIAYTDYNGADRTDRPATTGPTTSRAKAGRPLVAARRRSSRCGPGRGRGR